jgi:hypothetical protein
VLGPMTTPRKTLPLRKLGEGQELHWVVALVKRKKIPSLNVAAKWIHLTVQNGCRFLFKTPVWKTVIKTNAVVNGVIFSGRNK